MTPVSATSSCDEHANKRTARQHHEQTDALRNPYELDRHRVVTCTAFRRLQNKTQVFAPTLHDHFRNRLTHTLEVAQIARCLARNCGADQDLCEAISLAHDLGHPPFSHAGEKALNELMTGRGGFNHNAHSVRVVEYLEHPYPVFRGLNLTAATLDGLRAHATQYDVPSSIDSPSPSIEAQIASIADRIAYNLHDLEDAIGAEFVDQNQLSHVTLWRDPFAQIAGDIETTQLHTIRRPLLDTIVNRLLADVIQAEPGAQATGGSSLRFSSACETALHELETFLLNRVYHHPDVASADAEGQQKIHELFSAYMRDPDLLPTRFGERIADQGPHRVICDYIAGMTDNFCSAQHSQHCKNRGS
jgi:dGTPase